MMQAICNLHEVSPIENMLLDWDAFLRKRIQNVKTHHGVIKQDWIWLQNQLENFLDKDFNTVLLNAGTTDGESKLVRLLIESHG